MSMGEFLINVKEFGYLKLFSYLCITNLKNTNHMFIKYILPIIAIILTLIVYGFVYEIKHAKEVDGKEPFLWDDYDEKKDKTLK